MFDELAATSVFAGPHASLAQRPVPISAPPSDSTTPAADYFGMSWDQSTNLFKSGTPAGLPQQEDQWNEDLPSQREAMDLLTPEVVEEIQNFTDLAAPTNNSNQDGSQAAELGSNTAATNINIEVPNLKVFVESVAGSPVTPLCLVPPVSSPPRCTASQGTSPSPRRSKRVANKCTKALRATSHQIGDGGGQPAGREVESSQAEEIKEGGSYRRDHGLMKKVLSGRSCLVYQAIDCSPSFLLVMVCVVIGVPPLLFGSPSIVQIQLFLSVAVWCLGIYPNWLMFNRAAVASDNRRLPVNHKGFKWTNGESQRRRRSQQSSAPCCQRSTLSCFVSARYSIQNPSSMLCYPYGSI
ncbi:uncharacterized protein LOC133905301 [Phragmites australis]|uniref:uncharacterized protein LOC133905301 n=1 Tax=Phragmites australis TaxID=29695 RepID=UPI002D76C13C|nr:uncharacterized protein LOC133905301 [Phragmites australis]